MNHPQRLSIMERLALVEARLQIASEVVTGPYESVPPSDVWAALHVELKALAGELRDVVADLLRERDSQES